ncbi:MAG: flavodoxin [Oscillospiraceae bacterium]|jgi:flavodoxin|nr:flavodoxin [Oscillospiraceae bacterium]
MTTAVRYHSRSGNTKKLADAVAGAAGVTAEATGAALTAPVELVCVGGALYAGDIDARLKAFIQGLTPALVQTVAVFGTSAFGKSIRPRVAELLRDKGIAVEEADFTCKGRFLLTSRGRPNERDCADAAAFAQKLLGGR